MTSRTITAMFDSGAEAERAVQALTSEIGVSRSAVRLYPGPGAARPQDGQGLLASLRDLVVPDEDRYTYAEGMRRGSSLVTVQVDDSRLDRATDVLEHQGAVDLDAREAEWRSSGWTGYDTRMAAGTATSAVVGAVSDSTRTAMAAMPGDATTANPPGTVLSRGVDAVAGTNVSGAHPENQPVGKTRAGATGTSAHEMVATSEERIPIVEEQLRIGKREVQGGRVRVRSYVVETPVSEQVSLHSETAQVERRNVDLPLSAADDAAFRERSFEVTETHEEAVFSKEARVREELVVRKTGSDVTETVQDTVRRTEVEVEDTRGTVTGTSATVTGQTTATPGAPRR